MVQIPELIALKCNSIKYLENSTIMKWLLQIILAISIPVTTFATLPPAPVLATGQTLCYSSAGDIIDCAGTGQDGEVQSGLQWPNPRFTDRNDGTIKDNLTGLVWLKNAGCFGQATLMDAATNARTLESGICGLIDGSTTGQWRLPNIVELKSLVDKSHFNPALPAGYPFSNINNISYSSSYVINFKTVEMSAGSVKFIDATGHLWPVRDDNGAPSSLPQTGQKTSNLEGDDGALRKGIQWPSPRFADNNDGTVTDNLTGLTWLQDSSCFTANTWASSLIIANNLATGNCGLTDGTLPGDWRIPNVNELESVLSAELYNYALPLKHPFSISQPVPGNYWNYWSSNTLTSNSAFAWTVNMSTGVANAGTSKSDYFWIWPVRSRQYWIFDSFLISASSKFGIVRTDSPVTPRRVEIGNRGSLSQTITSISITGENASEFSISFGGNASCNSLTPTLSSGTSCTLMLSLSPSSSGTKSASLDITANGVTKNIPLSGKAINTVYGTVTDQATGLPVSGATVTLNTSVAATTDVAGNYNFGSLPAATYSISVANSGYQITSRNNFVVTTAGSAKADVLLPTIATLNITTSTFPWASPNVHYSNRVMVAGGTAPYIFSKSYGTLPTGLLLDTTTGTISGTPTGSGSYTFAIGVSDKESGYSEKEFTLELLPPLQITTAAFPSGQQGFPYNSIVTATGGKLAYSFAAVGVTLPNGLTLGSNGTITGTPKESGTFNVSVKLTDSTGITVIKSCSLTVTAVALALNTATLTSGYIGTNYSAALSASGGVYPLAFSISETLPAGILLNNTTGIISGTPSAAGFTNLKITVSDSSYPTPQTVTKILGLRIWPSQPYTFSVTLAGKGTGTVTSDSGGIACTSGTCSAELPSTTVNLMATPSSISLFGGWSVDCSGTGDCTLNLDASKSVTATFNLADKAKIGNNGYASFAESYAAADPGSVTTVMLLEDVLPVNTIVNKQLTLQGGYLPNFTRSINGETTLQGILVIGSGRVELDRIILK